MRTIIAGIEIEYERTHLKYRRLTTIIVLNKYKFYNFTTQIKITKSISGLNETQIISVFSNLLQK